jgi:Flp pilus assembly protein TadD
VIPEEDTDATSRKTKIQTALDKAKELTVPKQSATDNTNTEAAPDKTEENKVPTTTQQQSVTTDTNSVITQIPTTVSDTSSVKQVAPSCNIKAPMANDLIEDAKENIKVNQYDKAKESINKALELDPENEEAKGILEIIKQYEQEQK